MRDLTEILTTIESRGFVAQFRVQQGQLLHEETGVDIGDVELVDTIAADVGTDPGDDVTIYLLSTKSGTRGYLIQPDSIHTDPGKARFIDRLVMQQSRRLAQG